MWCACVAHMPSIWFKNHYLDTFVFDKPESPVKMTESSNYLFKKWNTVSQLMLTITKLFSDQMSNYLPGAEHWAENEAELSRCLSLVNWCCQATLLLSQIIWLRCCWRHICFVSPEFPSVLSPNDPSCSVWVEQHFVTHCQLSMMVSCSRPVKYFNYQGSCSPASVAEWGQCSSCPDRLACPPVTLSFASQIIKIFNKK